MTPGRSGGLAARLFALQLILIVLAGATMAVTALAVAPALFDDHLQRTGEEDPLVQLHAQQAFRASMLLALGAAGAVATLLAAAVTWFVARRMAGPVASLAESARGVAAGNFEVQTPQVAFSRELAELSSSFQTMADRLADTEAARARLMSDLAHELRTPLSTLSAHVDGLEDGVVAADAATWATMRGQLDRLQRLTSDLREASAAQEHALSLRKQPCDARQPVADAAAAAAPGCTAAGIALTVQLPDTEVPVEADPGRLQQVLAILLDNAARHTPAGGEVLVRAEQVGDRAVLTVSDTGPGIPAQEQERIFERFHRLDPARQSRGDAGSGLGLTIARAVVNDHGGTLTAQTPVSGGAQLRAELPLRQQ